MANAILYNNYDLINGNLINWNIAFNDPDFIDYIMSGSITSEYTGYENYIEDYQYQSRKYVIMNFPNVYGRIGSHAFESCLSLNRIYFSSTYTEGNAQSIGKYAFAGCSNLQYVYVYQNKVIEEYAFASLSTLSEVHIGPTTGWNLTIIKSHAFENCTDLSFAEISNAGIIYDYAFYNCYKLSMSSAIASTMKLLSNTSIIGNYAFYNCSKIVNVYIPAYSSKYIGDHVFEGCENLTTFQTSYIISIGAYAFRNLEKLSFAILSFAYDNSMLFGIGSHAFENCFSLSSLVITSQVGSIGAYAFKNCQFKSTNNISFVTYIGDNAFENCKSLSSISLGYQYASSLCLSYIGKSVFKNCTSLSAITLHGFYNFDEDIFYGCSNLSIFYNYAYRTNYSSYSTFMMKDCIITSSTFYSAKSSLTMMVDAFANIISDYAFKDFINLSRVSIGNYTYNSISSLSYWIKDYAFDGCISLRTLSCCDFYNYIGARAFGSCPFNTMMLSMNPTNNFIDSTAFSDCDNLNAISLYSLTSVEDETFKNHSQLYACYLYSNETIGNSAFENCYNLQNLYIPSTKNIGVNALKNCSNLHNLDAQYVISIGEGAFDGCENLSTITLRSISYINSYIFRESSNIQNLIIYSVNTGNYLTIESEAFSGCIHLLTFVESHVLTLIGDNVFHNCSALRTISIIPQFNSSRILFTHSTFDGCPNVEYLTIANTINIDSENYNLLNGFNNISDLYIYSLYYTSIFYNIFESNLNTVNNLLFSTLYINSERQSIFSNMYKFYTLKASYIGIDGVSNPFETLDRISTISCTTLTIIGPSDYHIFNNLNTLECISINGRFTRKYESSGNYCQTLTSDFLFGCDNIKSVSYYEAYDSTYNRVIGSYAFANKSLLEYVYYRHRSVYMAAIEQYAFYNDVLLNRFVGDESYEYIGSNAFENCYSLTSFEIRSCVSIYENAFKNCSSLSILHMEYYNSTKSIPILHSTDAFDGLPNNYVIWLSARFSESFINDPVWGLLSAHFSY